MCDCRVQQRALTRLELRFSKVKSELNVTIPIYKAFKKEQREAKRLLADEQKSLFAFYASLEETYESICPDMYLIANSHFNTDNVQEQQDA